MKVPLLDVRRQNLPIEREITQAFQRVLHSGQFILGAEVEAFEHQVAAAAGARFGIGMSSGTDAILAALMALGIGPGDEVICPTFTFFATGGCIARVGARPVFVDSRPGCFNIDPDAIEAQITTRTRALIPVHLFGQPADMDPILEIARRHGLAVIEDAAQAFGAEYHGRPVGALGDCATLSFFPSKNLGAFGDAGMLVTNDAALAERVRLLRNHGAQERYFHERVGGNFRLDALQAAMLAVKLPLLGQYTAMRQQHACEYERLLGAIRGREAVEIILPVTPADRTHIVNQYTLQVRPGRGWDRAESPRDALRTFLHQRGIDTAIYYPVPLHRQECFREFGPHADCPVADRLAAEVVSLPVFPELTPEELHAVADGVLEFVTAA